MKDDENKKYYDKMWEEITCRPSLALVDDETIKLSKASYDLGCEVAENLAKQKIDSYIQLEQSINANNIKVDNFIIVTGAALTLLSGTVALCDPSLHSVSSTALTLALTTTFVFKKKTTKINETSLISLGKHISSNNDDENNIKVKTLL